ncbi:hypothetical protein ES288_D06G032400v1 [Gossypium darwinii]|uniref:Protein kinase domain-containing protein n=1 Tax=Gossypium darwinii TaxID=34276 RepID=A0A5D2C521_GOSDA|nr:hypothetical protein ES288_D06G032400v1 [Gossypium darwinii]
MVGAEILASVSLEKATAKCDVYSFGVVLMELITGKKPVDADFREYKNIVYWVTTKLDTKEGVMEVLDKNLLGSFKDEMIQVLRIAICCTCKNPSQRPTMNEVLQLLIQTDPCLTDPYKFSTKTREASNVTENQLEEDICCISQPIFYIFLDYLSLSIPFSRFNSILHSRLFCDQTLSLIIEVLNNFTKTKKMSNTPVNWRHQVVYYHQVQEDKICCF